MKFSEGDEVILFRLDIPGRTYGSKWAIKDGLEIGQKYTVCSVCEGDGAAAIDVYLEDNCIDTSYLISEDHFILWRKAEECKKIKT